MTFGTEKDTAKELNLLKLRLTKTADPKKIDRLEAEIALLEMGITPTTNLAMG